MTRADNGVASPLAKGISSIDFHRALIDIDALGNQMGSSAAALARTRLVGARPPLVVMVSVVAAVAFTVASNLSGYCSGHDGDLSSDRPLRVPT